MQNKSNSYTSYGLPPEIMKEGHTLKLMYVWLEPQGVVNWSTQEVGDKLGITKKTVILNMAKMREIGVLRDLGDREERSRSEYYVKRLPIAKEVRESLEPDRPAHNPPFPD